MKQSRLLLLLVTLIAITGNSLAQENLDHWMKKCEKDPSVELTLVNIKNPETKKQESTSIEVIFKNNPALLKDLLTAYNKDKDDAYRTSETSVQGQMRPEYCRFMIDKTTEVRYVFTFSKDGTVSVYKKTTYSSENKLQFKLPSFSQKPDGNINNQNVAELL